MTFRALDGVERMVKKPKPKPKVMARPEVLPPEPPLALETETVIRNPRVTPTSKTKAVERIRNAEAQGGGLVTSHRMGVQLETQQRREQVLAWMLNGHLFEGELATIQQVSSKLGVPVKTVERDVSSIKEKMADYHVEGDERDIPALAYMLMEMKFQDRGRALALYNLIMKDIETADLDDREVLNKFNEKVVLRTLTGRDRAAMYNSALQALDLSNKATNGMDALFKLTGGAQKLQQIIHAKNVQINSGNGQVVTLDSLQDFVSKQMAGVLPSSRKTNPELLPPASLQLTAAEEAIMKVGGKK